jgi:hypothetical protein
MRVSDVGIGAVCHHQLNDCVELLAI